MNANALELKEYHQPSFQSFFRIFQLRPSERARRNSFAWQLDFWSKYVYTYFADISYDLFSRRRFHQCYYVHDIRICSFDQMEIKNF